MNKNFKLQRRPSIEITKNGNERAAGLSLTPHNNPRPPNWIIVYRCIFHVFTWKLKQKFEYDKTIYNWPINNLSSKKFRLTLRVYPTLGWCLTGMNIKNSLSNNCIPAIPDIPMYKNTPYKTAKGTCWRASAKTTDTPNKMEIAENETRWSKIEKTQYLSMLF